MKTKPRAQGRRGNNPVLTLPSDMSWPVEGELLASIMTSGIDNTLRIHVGVVLKAADREQP